MKAYDTVYEATDDPPAYAEAVANLYDWSTNYAPGEGPITLFLDIIGWSDDNLGERVYRSWSLGYVEIHRLAAALSEYADRPQDVREYVDLLLELEAQ